MWETFRVTLVMTKVWPAGTTARPPVFAQALMAACSAAVSSVSPSPAAPKSKTLCVASPMVSAMWRDTDTWRAAAIATRASRSMDGSAIAFCRPK